MAMTSTGEGRPGNNPASRHDACIERLQDIEREWRNTLPRRPATAPPRGRPPRGEPLKKRGEKWYFEMLKQPGRTKKAVAEDISKGAGVTPKTVEREARRARERRGTPG